MAVKKNKMSMSTYMTFVKWFSRTKLDNSPHVPSPAITAEFWLSPLKIELTLNSCMPMRDYSFNLSNQALFQKCTSLTTKFLLP
ncbi:hypothetical protein ACHAW6_005651 [Cyclotella cf. meneghiniana]